MSRCKQLHQVKSGEVLQHLFLCALCISLLVDISSTLVTAEVLQYRQVVKQSKFSQ